MSVIRSTHLAGQNDRPRNFVAGRFAAAPVLALTAWSLMGCYTYVPVAGRGVPVTGDGRVVLTDAGTAAMAGPLGPNVREIDGIILRATADSVVMTVAQTTTTSRERFISTGVTVAIARPLVQDISARTFSRKRSLTFGAAVFAILSVAFSAVTAAAASATGDGPGSIQP
ncbi:hypothetical protein [Gemmatimonas sp.]|jgi:hypothetical protein|uniref:hypothetical protein n=1 Tax=Gemmatimonas sp. TaxID=1962908 RepID=UPI0037BEA6A8